MRIDAILDAEFYIKVGDGQFVKYREGSYAFDDRVRNRLYENGHTHIYIKLEDIKNLNQYFEINLKSTLNDMKVDLREKTALLYDTTTYLVRELLQDPGSKENIKQSERVVETAVEFILSDPDVLGHHIELSSVDYYTYTHSVDVMTYSILLGKRLGLHEGSELHELGQGALLHDVGKAYVDQAIIQKPSSLTAEEWEIMKRHPRYGYNTLRSTSAVSENVLNLVLYHHEELGGSGYPDGKKAAELDLNVRIITAADVYNAMTTRRLYREAYKNFDALKMMKDMVGEKLDENVYREFVLMLGSV
jgi:HD-GYP domain-containing protein (c-di-GMP phosphodiesterase class II)